MEVQNPTVPPEETSKGVTGEGSAKKKGRTVAITTKDMQKRRNDVKARTTLLLDLPDEHYHVNDFDNVVVVRTKVTSPNEGSWGLNTFRKLLKKDVKPFVNTLKEYFHMFDQGLHKEITDMKEVFTQMETEAAKCYVERKTFAIKEKELLFENDRLLELISSQDLIHTLVNTLAAIADY
ncbi:hypothetical protein Tco_0987410 [Tanacetum coccineum]